MQPSFYVGVGASAGGLHALEEFFAHVSPASRCAFVVVQHLSPEHRSMMVELLRRRSVLPVVEATDRARLRPGTVLVLPPGSAIHIEPNKVRLTARPPGSAGHWPIDGFFESLAAIYGELAVGVVLTGTGSDGARGISAIRDHGGLGLAQDPEAAAFDGMPRAAIATGAITVVGSPGLLAQTINRLGEEPVDEGEPTESDAEADMTRVVTALQQETGLDFTHYKRATVERRIRRRMAMTGLDRFTDYARLASDSAEERGALFRDLLIGVTSFFRDPDVWDDVRDRVVVPALAESHRTEFRAWVAGCSTGEEAFTLAMVVREALDQLGGPQ